MRVTQLCPTLCDPMEYTVHGILQARIQEWVASPFSRGSSQPRDQTQVSHIAGGFFISWATREAQEYWSGLPIPSPVDLPNPGIKLGSPALQADSLPTELSGKPWYCVYVPQPPYSFGCWRTSKFNVICYLFSISLNSYFLRGLVAFGFKHFSILGPFHKSLLIPVALCSYLTQRL